MIWHRYRNEIIVLLSILMLLVGYAYKSSQKSASIETQVSTKYAVREFKELIDLKKRWDGKSLTSKVNRLQKVVPPNKIKWKKDRKKLDASFNSLTPKELNHVITAILNLPVEILHLDIKKNDKSYEVVLRCKW